MTLHLVEKLHMMILVQKSSRLAHLTASRGLWVGDGFARSHTQLLGGQSWQPPQNPISSLSGATTSAGSTSAHTTTAPWDIAPPTSTASPKKAHSSPTGTDSKAALP